ncbi:hypothetical protein [Spirillospora sp. NPDC047279]|uniref:hypothetical protein n=1 Tax=Spirillospora sp. NPDC047279 TaxID=3155478 RepID=UPI0033D308D0
MTTGIGVLLLVLGVVVIFVSGRNPERVRAARAAKQGLPPPPGRPANPNRVLMRMALNLLAAFLVGGGVFILVGWG